MKSQNIPLVAKGVFIFSMCLLGLMPSMILGAYGYGWQHGKINAQNVNGMFPVMQGEKICFSANFSPIYAFYDNGSSMAWVNDTLVFKPNILAKVNIPSLYWNGEHYGMGDS